MESTSIDSRSGGGSKTKKKQMHKVMRTKSNQLVVHSNFKFGLSSKEIREGGAWRGISSVPARGRTFRIRNYSSCFRMGCESEKHGQQKVTIRRSLVRRGVG